VGYNIRTSDGEYTILDLDGELDRHVGIKELRGAFAKLQLGVTTRLILNFKSVTYVCSEAVGEICAMADRIRKAGGRCASCGLSGLPRDVFELLGVHKILPNHETEKAAVQGLKED